MKQKKEQQEEISVLSITEGCINVNVLGRTPLILRRMSQKDAQQLLMPKTKTKADKIANLKHNPFQEYQDSPHKTVGNDAPTRLLIQANCFKGALRSVALDMPGVEKAQIGRLTYVEGDYVNVYGVPKIFMSIVRSADIKRTPDVRTRLIVPEWACTLSIRYVKPLLREQAVADLLAAAGIMRGVGDWRTEKGSGNYGQFELVGANDPRFKAIVKAGGRVVQDKALADPEPHDAETAELLSWFMDEAGRRGWKLDTARSASNGAGAVA